MSEMESFGAYISSRVRGMKSTLMTTGELDILLEKRDVDAMAQTLLSTSYEQEMAETLTRFQGADAIEEAVSRNMIATFARLKRAAGGDYRDMAKLFLTRWDLVAVKALLRNRHHELDAETGSESLVPGPSMPMALLKELGSQGTMDALVRGLLAWNPKLCRGLSEKLGDYQSSRDLRVLEDALDKNYFQNGMRRLAGAEDEDSAYLMNLLKMEIDRINLRTVLSAGDNADEAISRLLQGGRLPESKLREMANQPADRAVGQLEGTPYAAFAEELVEHFRAGNITRLERVFELALLEQLKRAARTQSIGIAILMHFAWLKYNEVMNLRMIARGGEANLAEERIREELVYA